MAVVISGNGVPYLFRVSMTSLLNWLIFILVNGVILYAAAGLACALVGRDLRLSLRLVAIGLIYFAQITVVVLLLGVVLKTLNYASVCITSLFLSALIYFPTRRERVPTLGPAWSSFKSLLAGRDVFLYLLCGLFGVQLVILLAKVVWLPPHIWDVFSYHLPPAVIWYQQGLIPSVIDIPVNRVNGAPLGMTVLAYWFFIFFRDDFLVEMPLLLWALLLVPVTYAIQRQADVSRPWALKFAIVTFFVPIVIMQSVTVKDHLGLNVSFVAGLLFLAAFLQSRNTRLLIVAGIAFGLMIGYKIAAPVHLLAALVVFLIWIWIHDRALLTNATDRLALFRTAGISAVTAFVIGAYWYVKNLVVFGHLQGSYGMSGSLAGNTAKAVGTLNAVTGKLERTSVIANLQDFFPRIFDAGGYYGADLVNISGYGPQFAAFGLLTLIMVFVALFKKPLRSQPVFLVAAAAVLLFIVMLFINHNANSYRILSFLPMALLAYAGVLLYQGGFFGQQRNALIINLILAVAVVWDLVTLSPPAYTNPRDFREFIAMDAGYRTAANYTRWFILERPEFYHLLHEIPVDEPIAYVSEHKSIAPHDVAEDTWTYLYYDRAWQRRAVYMNMTRYLDCNDHMACRPKADFARALQDKGVSFVSACKSNQCLTILDNAFFELAPGFYYYKGQSG